MIDVLKAYQEGEKIEYRNDGTNYKWTDVHIPSWNFDLSEYRVKPETIPRTFKLIKEFPLSPSLGTIVEFKTEKDFNGGIYDFGAICLILTDCTNYPEFWEEINDKKIWGYSDNLIGNIVVCKTGVFTLEQEFEVDGYSLDFIYLKSKFFDKLPIIILKWEEFNEHFKIKYQYDITRAC